MPSKTNYDDEHYDDSDEENKFYVDSNVRNANIN